MFKNMKMSKYNFTTYDHEGNLILYNFLKGISSLTKVMKEDVDKFKQLFLMENEITCESCKEHVEAVENMLKSGILIAKDTDESVLYNSKYYDKVYDGKLTLTILPTGKCNFKCIYCLESEQSFFRDAMTLDSQNAILQFVQKQIRNHSALQVAWFGGEPLLESKAIKYLSENFINICKTHFLPYSAQVTTNGFYLDADMFDMLYELKVYTYMVTIDGFKEQHDKLRFTRSGGPTYDRIMDNLLRIRDNKKYKFAHIFIRVNITKSFFDILDDFINYLESLFGDDPRFSFVFVPAEDYSNNKCSDDIFADNEEVSSRLLKNEIYTEKMYPEVFKLHLIEPIQGCISSLKNSYVIAPDLKIYKCCAHYDMDVNNIGQISSNGDLLLDESLHSKWYFANKFDQKSSDNCKNCFYLPVCNMNANSCPVTYFKSASNIVSCPLKNDEFIMSLNETVLYAAKKYSCTLLDL